MYKNKISIIPVPGDKNSAQVLSCFKDLSIFSSGKAKLSNLNYIISRINQKIGSKQTHILIK